MRVLIATLALLAAVVPATARADVPTCPTPDAAPLRSGTVYRDDFTCAAATSYRVVGTPEHLQAQVAWGGVFTVQGETGYTGSASFAFVASNVDGDAPPVTVTYNAAPDANRPPQCSSAGDAQVTRLGRPLRLQLLCGDPEYDRISLQDVSAQYGTALPSSDGYNSISYRAPETAATPLTDTIDAQITDGRATVDASTLVKLVGTVENTPPHCLDDQYFTYAGEETHIRLLCFDDENDPLTFTATSGPAHGRLADDTGGGFRYTADPGYTGADSITFSADDGHGGVATVTETIDVARAPAPSCSPVAPVSVRPGWRAPFRVDCLPSTPTVLSVIDGPAHGTLIGSDGDYAYRSDGGAGSDSIHFRATEDGSSTDIVVPITISAAADRDPRCSFTGSFFQAPSTTTFRMPLTATRRIAFTCADPDGDPLQVQFDTLRHGSIRTLRQSTDSSGTLAFAAVYTPSSGGDDTVQATVTDDHGGSTSATLTFHVSAAPDDTPPSCSPLDDGGAGPRVSEPTSFTTICRDEDGDPITYTASATGADVTSVHASSRPELDVVTVTMLAGATAGPATVTLTPSDATAGAPVTTPFSVRRSGANFAPSCSSNAFELASGDALKLPSVERSCYDADYDDLTDAVAVPPAHGTLDANHVYRADAGYSGSDQVTFRVADGHGGIEDVQWRLRVVAPATTIDTVLDGDEQTVTNDRRPVFTFRSPGRPAARFECELLGPPNGAWEPCTSPFTPDPLTDGVWRFSVRAVDAGEHDSTPASKLIYEDATPPEAPEITAQPPLVRFVGAALGDTYECRVDGGAWTACEPPQDVTGSAPGTHSFATRIVDAYGNASAAADVTWTVAGAVSPSPTATAIASPTTILTPAPTATVTRTPNPTVAASPTVTPLPTIVIADLPARDATPPHLAVNIPATTPKRIAARGLTVPVGCDEACAAAATVTISKRTAKQLGLGRHAMTIGRSPVTDATQQPLVIHFTKRVAKALRRARAVTLSVTVVAVDAAGNATQQQTTVRATR